MSYSGVPCVNLFFEGLCIACHKCNNEKHAFLFPYINSFPLICAVLIVNYSTFSLLSCFGFPVIWLKIMSMLRPQMCVVVIVTGMALN